MTNARFLLTVLAVAVVVGLLVGGLGALLGLPMAIRGGLTALVIIAVIGTLRRRLQPAP